MVNVAPGGVGTRTPPGVKFWVIPGTALPGKGGANIQQFTIVQGAKAPANKTAGPFSTRSAAQNWINGVHASNPSVGKLVTGFFGGLGGMIGSGIEAGFIQSLKDIWDVIIGPAEVILGFLVAAFVLVVYFKDDILAGVGMLARVMAVAA